ncbi:MAG: Tfp pilus assembly protein FimT/FimU [Phycisphaerales bacterium JB043]
MGFSLTELIAIVSILGAMALSAAPALHRIESSRQSGARDEVARLLAVARASALATGDPYGLEIDADNEEVSLVYIDDGGSPQAAPNATGQPSAAFPLASLYPGVEITSFVSGSGSSSHTTIWFGFSAIPETRDASGGSRAAFTQDAVITISGGKTITVRRETGAIE